MPRTRAFGISTHLFHGQRLTREHLREMRGAGFDAVELCATRTHFDYHNASSIADLRGWLAESGLTLASVHAPVADSVHAGRWGVPFNLATSDRERRAAAVEEVLVALQIARQLPFAVFVLHAGLPRGRQTGPGESSRDALRRSLETLATAAAPLGVTLALEVLPNELSKAGPLVHFVETVLEDGTTGICLDVGHAQLQGDPIDVIETVAEHVLTVDVHDNHGRADDHLVPFDGAIDWPATVTAIQKVGYEGPVMFELAGRGSTKDTLAKARTARDRIDRLLAHR